jgi:hypothetical protein
MGWAGSGALIAWHDVEEGREAECLDWRSHEHMQERLAIPGFFQGHRYSVVGSGPQFLILYAVKARCRFAPRRIVQSCLSRPE